MVNLPEQLLDRLSESDALALKRAVQIVGEELHANYRANVADHREARGDNAQLFGMKIWVHGRFRLEGRFEDDPEVRIVDVNGSYCLRIGPLSVGVYKVGDLLDDDVHHRFPDTSTTKRSYGERNRDQLTLFEASGLAPPVDEAAYALNDLTIAHFGNPREGLVKWYAGAFVADELGRLRWAWLARQGLEGLGANQESPSPPIVPFSEREVEDFQIAPRIRSDRDVADHAE